MTPSPTAARPLGMIALALLMATFAGTVHGDTGVIPPPAPLPNADFTAGDAAPHAWRLSGGEGRWVDGAALEVTGGGEDSNAWFLDSHPFTPRGRYHFAVRARRPSGAGSMIAGPAFANRDYPGVSSQWQWFGHAFRVPDGMERGQVRVGQWHTTGSLQFDAVRLTPVIPVHTATAGLVLGEGESIRQGQYRFDGSFEHDGSNDHRTLVRATAGFNSDRWVFGAGSEVIYRFDAPAGRFDEGAVEWDVNYHVRGGCIAAVSRDGDSWHVLEQVDGVGSGRAAVPAELLPAETLFLRLAAAGQRPTFQVNRVQFEGALDGAVPEAVGSTLYAMVESLGDGLAVEGMTRVPAETPGRMQLSMAVRNPGSDIADARLDVRPADVEAWAAGGDDAPRVPEGPPTAGDSARIDPGETATLAVELPAETPGEHWFAVALRREGATRADLAALLPVTVAEFHRADYGYLLGEPGETATLWWCEAGWKVPRDRPPPKERGEAVRLAAARRDREGAQIVVRSAEGLRGLSAEVGPLTGPEGTVIDADRIEVLRVYYHFVHSPTDATGIRAYWPDALPPLDEPIDVAAGENQPLWIAIEVPADAPAGSYRGTVALTAEGFAAEVPIELTVWDFALPERNHIETAFGFSPQNVFRYHQLTDEADRRRVLDLYFEAFARNRISPYDPTPLDSIRVHFRPEADPPRADVDFSAFDSAMERAIEQFGFTGFRLRIPGMGGGTFHSRYEPRIGEFGEETEQYQAMFASLVEQLEAHLRERGWLDMAYIYWFDEPAPRDYPFVAAGMERLKRYAPGLRRMLTEKPVEDLFGLVDIWCPVSHQYDHEAAEARRAEGKRFWWYVCTVPKAPYATLFIDHPATELRVWLWQTWERNIDGVLVWQTNYWTSSAAFPDEPQNPYEDPMGYVSGYSTPPGVRRHWGNGDGRFIYPPLAAAVPGAAGEGAVIAPPVSSIRWEMLREGIEDWEYLYKLRGLIEQHRDRLSAEERVRLESLLEVPESITADMTTFTNDPRPIHEHRARVATAIERLRSGTP